jgi:hypothetical protein
MSIHSPNRQALPFPFLPIKNHLLPNKNSPISNSKYTHSTHRTHISQTLDCRWSQEVVKIREKLGDGLTKNLTIELIVGILKSG